MNCNWLEEWLLKRPLHSVHIYFRWPTYRGPFFPIFNGLDLRPNTRISNKNWTGNSLGINLCLKKFFDPPASSALASQPLKISTFWWLLMDMGYTLKVLLSQKNHSLKICVCIFQDVGSYEAPKSNKAGLRFSKWKVEIFNFFWHQNFFQNKSIGYEVTWLYRFWIFRQFIGFWKKVKFQKSPKLLKMAILPICGSQPRCTRTYHRRQSHFEFFR